MEGPEDFVKGDAVSCAFSRFAADQPETIALDAVAALIRFVREECGLARVLLVEASVPDHPTILIADDNGERSIPEAWLPTLSRAASTSGDPASATDVHPIVTAFDRPEPGTLLVSPPLLPGEGERILLCGWSPDTAPIPERAVSRFRRIAPIIGMGIQGDRLHHRRRASLQAMLEHLRESITIIGPDNTLIFESPAARRMLGYGAGVLDDLTEPQLAALIHPDDRPVVAQLVADLTAVPELPRTAEYRARHADGSWRWLTAYATNLTADPAIGGFVYSTVDTTAQKELEAKLEYDATHDFLTGIANRAAMERALGGRLDAKNEASLLYFDLDGFHGINSAYGHAAGDGVLQEVAHRLDRARQPDELVSRFGGDEFLILTPTADFAGVHARAAAFLACFREDCQVGERSIPVRASIGVARAPRDGTTFSTLYRAADRALYRIKGKSSERIGVFDERLDGSRAMVDTLAQEFAAAATAGSLRLHYQPIVDLRTNDVIGYEGLVRWDHPTFGLLTPHDILPVVDEFGFGDRLAQLCVTQAITAIQRLSVAVAVNLSAGQLHYPELAVEIANAVQRSGVDPGLLILEVTESATIVSQDDGLRALRALHDLGVRIAIDDFGTGYSDLAALRTYPLDILKIDRSFITALDGHKEDYALVIAILGIARALNLEVIAEGIETTRQREVISTLGCRLGQGFALGYPQPIEDLARPAPN